MPDSVTAVVAAAAVALCAECAYGLTGFGVAIIFQLGWYICGLLGVEGAGAILDGVVMLTVMGLSTNLVQLGAYKLKNDRMMTALFVGSDIVGTTAGTLVLTRIHTTVWLQRGVGVFLLLVGADRLLCMRTAPPSTNSSHSTAAPPTPETAPSAADAAGTSAGAGTLQRAREEEKGAAEVAAEAAEDAAGTPDPAPACDRTAFDIRRPCTKLACLAAGGSAGLLSGLCGVGGPALMVFVLKVPWQLEALVLASTNSSRHVGPLRGLSLALSLRLCVASQCTMHRNAPPARTHPPTTERY
jgi:hypothetical protein